jgi:hypothetical protein
LLVAAVAVLVATATAAADRPAATDLTAGVVRSRHVGINLAAVGYWSSQFPFADLMKTATPWAPREDSGGAGAPFPSTTPDGYPASLRAGQRAITTLASDISGYPSGRYVVLWDGEGSLGFPRDIATIVESSRGRLVLEVKAARVPLWLSLDATRAGDPVRNVRVLWPGTESTYRTQPFNPLFLSRIAPFSSLRFMDWGETNHSPVVNWADRALVSDPTYQTAKGVPLELMIDLANRMRADPWFCIPHRATDDYVRSFAALVKSRLDPTLKPHIEYSNEMWNTGFGQTTWGLAESDRLGLKSPHGTPSQFYAQRSVQVFKLVQGVYGADKGRLVRVIAGQTVWSQFLESALAFKDTAANADVMAIAPYFIAEAAADKANVEASLRLSSDQVVDQMFANVRGPVASWIGTNAALARRHGLTMKAYESGSGNVATHFPADKVQPMTELFSRADRHPRMRELYAEYYRLWVAKGGDTMNQYLDISAWKPWGTWGALESVTQDPATSPKYQGLLDAIAAHRSVR